MEDGRWKNLGTTTLDSVLSIRLKLYRRLSFLLAGYKAYISYIINFTFISALSSHLARPVLLT